MGVVLLVENQLSTIQFSDNVIDDDGDAKSSFPPSRVGRGSRLASNRWEPSTPNAEHWLRWRNVDENGDDVARNLDMIAVDRGHNLDGHNVILESSPDGSVWSTVLDVTVPSSSGGDPGDANGVLTEEGAWLKTFTQVSAIWYRLRIPAMGADLVPQIVGLYASERWDLAGPLDTPFHDELFQVRFPEQMNENLWIGAGAPRDRKLLRLNLRLENDAEYTEWRRNVLTHFKRRRPMWVVHDTAKGERAALFVVASDTEIGLPLTTDWPFRGPGSLVGVEHEPEID